MNLSAGLLDGRRYKPPAMQAANYVVTISIDLCTIITNETMIVPVYFLMDFITRVIVG